MEEPPSGVLLPTTHLAEAHPARSRQHPAQVAGSTADVARDLAKATVICRGLPCSGALLGVSRSCLLPCPGSGERCGATHTTVPAYLECGS